jgi:hypothetical protein
MAGAWMQAASARATRRQVSPTVRSTDSAVLRRYLASQIWRKIGAVPARGQTQRIDVHIDDVTPSLVVRQLGPIPLLGVLANHHRDEESGCALSLPISMLPVQTTTRPQPSVSHAPQQDEPVG